MADSIRSVPIPPKAFVKYWHLLWLSTSEQEVDKIAQTLVFSQKDLFKGYPASRVASIFLLAGYLKEGEGWEKSFSKKIIATLVTQGLPSSVLSRPIA